RGGYVWSGRLTYRAHVEVTHSNRWHRRPREPVAPLPGQRDLGSPDFAEPAEQVDRALVEPKVIHGAGDLAPLDHVDTVPCEPGEEESLRIDLPDVPQAGDQESTPGIGHHLTQRACIRLWSLHDQVVDGWCDSVTGLGRGC